jgi:phosphoribosyl 1,2-cyclic phosphodiesterase
VRKLVLFHHDPDHDDEMMAGVERDLAAESDGNIVAREGLELTL